MILKKFQLTAISAVSTLTVPVQTKFKTVFSVTLCALSTALLTVTPAQAKSLPTDPDARLSVGANIIIDSSPYDVEDAETLFLPSVYYDNNRVYARGSQAGVYAINDNANQVNIFVAPMGHHFDPDNVHGKLEGLDEREASLAAGASYTRRTPIGAFRLQAMTDVSGESDGVVAKAAYLARYTSGSLTLYPSIGVAWHDDSYNEHYFSVSSDEANKTGVAQYDSEASFSPYININANIQFNDKWAGFVGQSVSYLADEQYDSPMVVDRVNYRTTLGMTYTFD